MKKIKCTIHYPWAGIQDDECIVEIEDDATEAVIEEIANETLEEMIWDRISGTWERIE